MVENGRHQAIKIAKELCNLYLGNIDLIQTDANRKGDLVLSNAAGKTAEHITQQMQMIKHATDYQQIQKMLQDIINIHIHNLNVLVLQRSYALNQKREDATRQLYKIWQLYTKVEIQLGLLETFNKKFLDLGLSDHLSKEYLSLESQVHRMKTDTDLSVFQKQVDNLEQTLLRIHGDLSKFLDKQQKTPDKIHQEKQTTHPFWPPAKEPQILAENPSKTSRLRK